MAERKRCQVFTGSTGRNPADAADLRRTSDFAENMEALDELSRVSALEQKMDDMTEDYRNRMMHRIQEGTASGEGSVLYTEMLTDFERIGDHALNIAQEMTEVRLAE